MSRQPNVQVRVHVSWPRNPMGRMGPESTFMSNLYTQKQLHRPITEIKTVQNIKEETALYKRLNKNKPIVNRDVKPQRKSSNTEVHNSLNPAQLKKISAQTSEIKSETKTNKANEIAGAKNDDRGDTLRERETEMKLIATKEKIGVSHAASKTKDYILVLDNISEAGDAGDAFSDTNSSIDEGEIERMVMVEEVDDTDNDIDVPIHASKIYKAALAATEKEVTQEAGSGLLQSITRVAGAAGACMVGKGLANFFFGR